MVGTVCDKFNMMIVIIIDDFYTSDGQLTKNN